MRVSDARFHGFFGTHWHPFAKGNRLDIRWKHPNPLCWDSIEGRLQEDGWGIENAEKEKGSEKGSEEKRGQKGVKKGVSS